MTFVLDDTMVLLASLLITFTPPGRAFGSAWKDTCPFKSSDDNTGHLPLQLGTQASARRRNLKRTISQPYPIAPVPVPTLPAYRRITPPTGLNPSLAPLISPRQKPVYQRPPYDLSPALTVPFRPAENTPLVSPIQRLQGGVMSTLVSSVERKKKNSGWPLASPDASQLVRQESLWS